MSRLRPPLLRFVWRPDCGHTQRSRGPHEAIAGPYLRPCVLDLPSQSALEISFANKALLSLELTITTSVRSDSVKLTDATTASDSRCRILRSQPSTFHSSII